MPEWSEILVILVVAMVVFGPHRMPAMARKAGKMMAEFRAAARELREGIEKELAVEEMREVAQDVMSTTKEATGDVRKSLADSEKALRTPPPLARPTDTAPGAERHDPAGAPPDPDPDPTSEDGAPAPDPESSTPSSAPTGGDSGSGSTEHPAPETPDRGPRPDHPS